MADAGSAQGRHGRRGRPPGRRPGGRSAGAHRSRGRRRREPGRYVEDLEPLIDQYCEPLGSLLTERALELLGAEAEGYGKGALVGLDGEIEHGSAIIHNLRFGNRVRDPVDGTSLLPAAEKRGAAGAPIDLAIKHKHDHSVRSHHQTFEVRIPDAPRADEIVIWVALATGGRPLSRLGAFGSELAATS